MPFRRNFFNEQIAQPGTTYSEIDRVMLNERGIAAASIWTADLFVGDSSEDEFKVGGSLFLSGEDMEEGETKEVEMAFDGFDSVEDAKAWLRSLDTPAFDINEVE
jgi:hypothetical protein